MKKFEVIKCFARDYGIVGYPGIFVYARGVVFMVYCL